MRTPNTLIGVVLGVLLGWAGVALVAYAGTELSTRRMARMADPGTEALPWLLALLALAAVVGALMSLQSIGAGVMAGAGLLLAVTGVALQLLPLRAAVELVELFELPGTRSRGVVLLLAGAMAFFGVILLVVGVRRLTTDQRSSNRMPPYYLDGPQQFGDPQQFRQAQPGLWPGPPGQRPGPQDHQPPPH